MVTVTESFDLLPWLNLLLVPAMWELVRMRSELAALRATLDMHLQQHRDAAR